MKKRLLSILMVTAMCATMAVGCGTADDTKDSSSSSKGKSDYLVGFANNSDTYNYCAKFRSYLKDATEAKGISITVTDAGGDTNVQNGQIDDFIVQNANVVSAISNDLDGSIPALEAAKDAGLPYVSFLTSVSGGDDYDGYIYVGSPNEDICVMHSRMELQSCILPVHQMISSMSIVKKDWKKHLRKIQISKSLMNIT